MDSFGLSVLALASPGATGCCLGTSRAGFSRFLGSTADSRCSRENSILLATSLAPTSPRTLIAACMSQKRHMVTSSENARAIGKRSICAGSAVAVARLALLGARRLHLRVVARREDHRLRQRLLGERGRGERVRHAAEGAAEHLHRE